MGKKFALLERHDNPRHKEINYLKYWDKSNLLNVLLSLIIDSKAIIIVLLLVLLLMAVMFFFLSRFFFSKKVNIVSTTILVGLSLVLLGMGTCECTVASHWATRLNYPFFDSSAKQIP